MTDLPTLDSGDLATALGGVDSETRKGHGAYHSLDSRSMAIADSMLRGCR